MAIEQYAPVERVDVNAEPIAIDPSHEVRWEVNAVDREPQAIRECPVEDREGDRNPGFPLDDLVEVAVLGVVVVFGIAGEAFFDEEHPVDLTEDELHLGVDRCAVAY